jgi:hypothetical protein
VEKKMKLETFEADDCGGASHRLAGNDWRVNRIDIRSPLSHLRGHIVRVELEHATRGRVTDIGSANDILGAGFAAVAHIFGCKASIVSVHSSHRTVAADGGYDKAMAAIVVDVDGVMRRGAATGQDLIYACLAAFIDAVTNGKKRDGSLLSAGLNEVGDDALLAARPCQTSGLDENGDWWLFASDDAGAAKAIADEFRCEGYDQVRVSLPRSNPNEDCSTRVTQPRS